MTLKKYLKGMLFVLFVIILFGVDSVHAQKAFDQYGFGKNGYLIQSALEAGKSTKAIWDLPGKNKFDSKKWQKIQSWARDRGKDGHDRIFMFSPAQLSAAGRYFIKFRYKPNWGVNALDNGSGSVEARSRSDHFELKHLGNGRWKIYYKNGQILSLQRRSSKNGVKVVLTRDHNGKHGQWVFFNARTNKSFIPRKIRNTTNHESNNATPTVPFSKALRSKDTFKNNYFSRISSAQFMKDNHPNKMKEYYDKLKPSKQWVHVLNTVKAVNKNSDKGSRRIVYDKLLTVNIKDGSNFIEKVLRTKVAAPMKKIEAREKDSLAKRKLKELIRKFK